MIARIFLCVAAFSLSLVPALTASAHTDDITNEPPALRPKNGSIGVAHLVEMFERVDGVGTKALIIVTTDEDFAVLSTIAGIGTGINFYIDVLDPQMAGKKLQVALRCANGSRWIRGRVAKTGQRVYLVSAKHAHDWH